MRRIAAIGIGSFVLGAAIAGETLRPGQTGVVEPPLVPLPQQDIIAVPGIIHAELPMRTRLPESTSAQQANSGGPRPDKPILNTAQTVAAQLAEPDPYESRPKQTTAVPQKKSSLKSRRAATRSFSNARGIASARRAPADARAEMNRQMRLIAQQPTTAPEPVALESAEAPRPGLKAKIKRLWRGIKAKFH